MTVKELQKILETKDEDQIVKFEYTTKSCFYVTEEVTAARTQSDNLILLGNCGLN